MPGRTRVRVTGLKGKTEKAKSLELLLHAHQGVEHVSANPLTSNVLIRFDAKVTSHEAVLIALEDLGHLPLAPSSSTDSNTKPSDKLLNDIGLNLGKELAKIALKQALKGSPAALILELI